MYVLSSGVNLRPAAFMMAIDSLCVTSVGHVDAPSYASEYRSVRKLAVLSMLIYAAADVADALLESILPHSVLNSARVRSEVQQLTRAEVALCVALAG